MEDKRLESLMTYTVFHIGIYVSLFTALLGAGIFGELDHVLLRFGIACFLLAGLCGAVVGSNIPENTDFTKFYVDRIGFWGFRLLPTWLWIRFEHLAFWLGILPIGVWYFWFGSDAFQMAPTGGSGSGPAAGP